MTRDDNNLKEALRNYSKDFLLFLYDNTPPNYLLQDLLSTYIPRIITFYAKQEKIIPVSQLPEAQGFKDAMRNHPVVGQHLDAVVGTEIRISRVEVWDVLQKFMSTLITQQQGLTFDEKAFDYVFESMMTFFRSDTLSVQYIIPLERFVFMEDAVSLSNGWKLKRISEVMREEWVRDATSGLFSSRTHLWTSHALLKTFEMKKVIIRPGDKRGPPTIFNLINDEIETTISAFRLLKKGCIVVRAIDRQIIGWHPWFSENKPWDPNIPGSPGPSYLFSVLEVSELNKVIDLLSYSKSDEAFQVALRRLNYATERGHIVSEDRILDVMIAFESLFGSDGELRYRISLRLAMFLGESSKEREVIQNDLGYAYNLRSRIIHGNKEKQVQKVLKKWGLNLGQAADRLEDLLRRVLLKYMRTLKAGKDHDAIIQAQEERVLNDASLSLLDLENLPDSALIDYLVSLGGTPKRVVELLREREAVDEKRQK